MLQQQNTNYYLFTMRVKQLFYYFGNMLFFNKVQ